MSNKVGSLLYVTFFICLLQCRELLANYHPNDFMHGLLAGHVYETSTKSDTLLDNKEVFYDLLNVPDDQKDDVLNRLLNKWSIHEVIDDKKTGYYGVIYKNDQQKHLVLAHRGTNRCGSFFEDLHGVVQFKITEFHLKFKEATRKVVDLVKKSPKFAKYSLSFTGHSLGAWIADMSVYYCHRLFNHKHVKGVTFEAPGSEIMMQLLEECAIKGPEDNFDVKKLDIVSYLSMPNLINSVNRHVGQYYLVNNTNYKKQLDWISKTIHNFGNFMKSDILGFSRLFNEHGLNFILEMFNHETGRPHIIQKIERWPSITLKDTKNMLNRGSTVNSVNSFLKLYSEDVHIPSLKMTISKGVLATMLTYVASLTSKVSILSDTLQHLIHFVTKVIGAPLDIISAGYSDTDRFRMIAHYVSQNKYNISIEHAEIYFKVKEHVMFDERYIVDTIDESIKGLVYRIKSAIDACEKDDVLLEDIHYIRRCCRYDSNNHRLSVTKADLVMQDIRDRGYRIYSKYPLIENIKWSVDLKESIANEFLSVVSPGKYIDFDKPSYTQIDGMFKENKAVLITGIGGVGKSTLALLYSQFRVSKELNNFCVKSFVVHSSEDMFQEYFDKWIDLFYRDREEQDMLRKQVRSSNKREREYVNNQINAKLMNTKYKFLFIFDGFEKTNGTICEFELIEMIIRNLPRNFKLLITSRLSESAFRANNIVYFKSYKLEMLENSKASQFLQQFLINLIGKKEDCEINSKCILEKIGGERFLPFQLYLVVTFINENRFKESLQRKIEKLVNFDLLNKNISQILFTNIYEKSEDIRQFLQIISYMDAEEINKELLTEVIGFDQKKIEKVFNDMEREHLLTLKYMTNGKNKIYFPSELWKYLPSFVSKRVKDKLRYERIEQFISSTDIFLKRNDITENKNLVRALNKFFAKIIDQSNWKISDKLVFIFKTISSASLKILCMKIQK